MNDRDEEDRKRPAPGSEEKAEPAPREEESPEYWHDAPGQSDLEEGTGRPGKKR